MNNLLLLLYLMDAVEYVMRLLSYCTPWKVVMEFSSVSDGSEG